jgi:hypothetical protein
LVLLDKDGQPAHALMIQGYYSVEYGQMFDRSCVALNFINQRAVQELQVHLATGTFEPCYPAYASLTELAKTLGGSDSLKFHSSDCTGSAYGSFNPSTRYTVAGVLQEPHGAALAPIGQGTGEPASYYENKVCKDASAEGPFEGLRAFGPVDAEFKAAFSNPPYSVKIVY